MGWTSAHVLDLGRRGLSVLLLTTLGLQLVAGVGLAYAAGFGEVERVLGRFTWPWLLAIAGALAVSFAGYHEAYRGSFGPKWQLPGHHRTAVALAGFGGFLAHGATALDVAALRAGGADRRDTAVRVSAFSGLEYGVMAVAGCGAAIAVLVTGMPKPPPSFTLPWAIIPLPGFLVAFWLARRYRERLADSTGWRKGVGIFLESIELVREFFAHPLRRHSAVFGMAVFWAGDTCAAWCGLALFGFRMDVAPLIVGFATGMVLTRRSTPLAGAGLLSVVLPVTVMLSGAPLAVAVPGMFVYQVLTLWLPTAISLATMDTLRTMVDAAQGGQPGTVSRAK